MFKKFGKHLKGEDKHGFTEALYGIKPINFKTGINNPILRMFAAGISKASLENLSCARCGSEYRVEMHHVRMLKDLNPKAIGVNR